MAVRIFISYSHDSAEHDSTVLALAHRLRGDGLDVVTDVGIWPPRGWTVWMRQQVKDAQFVLMICTATYQRRAEGDEEPPLGAGATWEGAIIRLEIYRANGENRQFIPVLIRAEDQGHRPYFVWDFPYFLVADDQRYQELLRLITPESRERKELPHIWSVPARNKFFSGREAYLDELHASLKDGGAAMLTQAIKGIGGIGKTQTAIEYAYRHRSDYQAAFWISADSRNALVSGFAALCGPFGFPPQQDLAKGAGTRGDPGRALDVRPACTGPRTRS